MYTRSPLNYPAPARFFLPLSLAGVAFWAYVTRHESATGQDTVLLVATVILSVSAVATGTWLLHDIRVASSERRLARQYPDEPWRWRRTWANGRVRSSAFRRMLIDLGAFLVAVIVAGGTMTMIILTLLDPSVNQTSGQVLMMLVLGLFVCSIALFVLRRLIRSIRNWRVWRRSAFLLQPFPANLGARCAGGLELPAGLADFDITCKMGCYRILRRKNSGHSRLHRTPLWESDTQTLRAQLGASTLPVHFDLPKGWPESHWANPDERVQWRLTVRVADYEFFYDMPIFNR